MPKKYDHTVHKYELISPTKKGKSKIYRCALPDCMHYVVENIGRGKYSLCWKCGEVYIITGRVRNTRRPKCGACLDAQAGRRDDKIPAEAPSTIPASVITLVKPNKIDELAADHILELMGEGKK